MSKGARPNHPADRNFSVPPSLADSLFFALSSADYRGDRYNHASTCETRLFAVASSKAEMLAATSIKSLSQPQICVATQLFSKSYRDFFRNPREIITYLFLPPTYRNFAPLVSCTYGHSPRQRFWNDNLVHPARGGGGTSTFVVLGCLSETMPAWWVQHRSTGG